MRQVTIEVFDCKADKERPAANNRVIVSWGGYWWQANYRMARDEFEITDSCSIPFTDADEWYIPIGGK